MIDQPLNSTEQNKIIIFIIFLLPIIVFGVGILPALFLGFGIYMMKRNSDFSYIETATNNFKIYMYIASFAISVIVIGLIVSHQIEVNNDRQDLNQELEMQMSKLRSFELQNPYVLTTKPSSEQSVAAPSIFRPTCGWDYSLNSTECPKYKAWQRDKDRALALEEYHLIKSRVAHIKTRLSSEYLKFEPEYLSQLLLIFVPLFYVSILKKMFYRPLYEHRNWVDSNGIFSTSVKEDVTLHPSSLDIDITKTGKLNSYSVADELLKWAKLKDDGLISNDEYEKAKSELLNK